MSDFQASPVERSPKIAFAMQNVAFEHSEARDEEKSEPGTCRTGPCYEFKIFISILNLAGLTLSKDTLFVWPVKRISQPGFIVRLLLQVFGVLALWANMVRSWALFRIMPSQDPIIVSSRVISAIWSTQCALQATVCAFRWHSIPGVQSPFQEFNSFFHKNQNLLCTFVKKGFITKITRGFLVCFTCGVVVNMALSAYMQFAGGDKTTSVWMDPLPSYTSIKLLFLFFGVPYLSVTFLMPMGFYFIFCLLIFHQCNNLEKMMKSCVERNDVKQIPELRRIHCCICDEIAKADDLFTYISLLVYLNLIPLVCFILYTFLFTSSTDLALHVSLGVWTVICIGILAAYSFAGALLNTKVHSQIIYLQRMRMQNVDTDTQVELMLFISKLNGQPIAFTVGRIIVIDNSLITTVLGVVLTYFALLYQIK